MARLGKVLLGLFAGFLLGLLATWFYTRLRGPLTPWGKLAAGYISLSFGPTVDYYVHRGNDYWFVVPLSIGMLVGSALAHLTATMPAPA